MTSRLTWQPRILIGVLAVALSWLSVWFSLHGIFVFFLGGVGSLPLLFIAGLHAGSELWSRIGYAASLVINAVFFYLVLAWLYTRLRPPR